jgi:hypothetical protein
VEDEDDCVKSPLDDAIDEGRSRLRSLASDLAGATVAVDMSAM